MKSKHKNSESGDEEEEKKEDKKELDLENYKPPKQTAIPFVTFEDGKFYSAPYDLKEKVDSEYSIQRVLYSYCLIKWLADMYDISESDAFDNHFGGIYYAFARGTKPDTSNGIYAQTWQNFSYLKQAYDAIAINIKNISTNSGEEK